MPVQSTDVFLVHRAGVNYQVTAANANTLILDTDLLLVNRAGVDYKITGANFKAAAFQNADLYLVNRVGISYKATGAEVKAILSRAPVIASVTLSEVTPGGNRFTSQSFAVTATMTEDGIPVSTKKLKAWVDTTGSRVPLTSAITQVTQTPAVGWTLRTPSSDASSWYEIAWSPELGLFAAGATSGAIRAMTSPDGVTWTSRTVPDANKQWGGMCWVAELGLFVSVAEGGANGVMTSQNGITWTGRTAAGNSFFSYRAITWSPALSLLAAVSYSTATTGNRVMTSPDGINWTGRSTPDSTITGVNAIGWEGICWSPQLSLFVAVGGTSSTSLIPSMWSTDGMNWTLSTSTALSGSLWRKVVWSPELSLFVAVATSGTVTGATSSDGKNWTTINDPIFAGTRWVGICWSAERGIFMAVSDNRTGHRTAYSANGINWTTAPSASDTNGWGHVTWSPQLGIFCASASTGSQRIMTSADGGVASTELTFTDSKDLALFTSGMTITEVGGGANANGSTISVDVPNLTMRTTGNTDWSVGAQVQGTAVTSNVKLYGVLNASGALSDLRSADPGFTAWTPTGSNPYTGSVTFPATLPSGNAPDVELPSGSSITVAVEATNASGTVSTTSSTVTPS